MSILTKPVSFIATSDPAASRTFYESVLELSCQEFKK